MTSATVPSPAGEAIQDHYPDEMAQCYGCGAANAHGMQLKTRWDGDETVTVYEPLAVHTAMPGFVYGGLVASLVDCHGTATGSLAAHRTAGHEPGDGPSPRFVTGRLEVDYRKPTPMGVPLVARGRVVEQTEKKVISEISVTADGVEVVQGRVVAVRIPDTMRAS